MVDLEAIKARQQAAWAAGDFSTFASLLVLSSELLCEAVDLRAGQRVLDVACGSGNTALSAARRGAEVVGVDFVVSLLERGVERARAERLPIAFVAGDAERLPFADASFAVVLSTFGAMFAPDQDTAAGELARVCVPGGTIGLASFPTDGFAGELFRITARVAPPPRGVKPVGRWGTDEGLGELFGERVRSIRTGRRSMIFRFRSDRAWLDFFRRHFGPVRSAFEGLDGVRRDRLESDLLDHIRRFNRSDDGTIVAPVDYIEAILRRA